MKVFEFSYDKKTIVDVAKFLTERGYPTLVLDKELKPLSQPADTLGPLMSTLMREDAYALGVALGQCTNLCRFKTAAVDVVSTEGKKALSEILGEDWFKVCFSECGICYVSEHIITIIMKVPVEYYNYLKKVYSAPGLRVRRSGYALFWRRDIVLATLRTHTDLSLSPQ